MPNTKLDNTPDPSRYSLVRYSFALALVENDDEMTLNMNSMILLINELLDDTMGSARILFTQCIGQMSFLLTVLKRSMNPTCGMHWLGISHIRTSRSAIIHRKKTCLADRTQFSLYNSSENIEIQSVKENLSLRPHFCIFCYHNKDISGNKRLNTITDSS